MRSKGQAWRKALASKSRRSPEKGNQGKGWEAVLDGWHRLYVARGLAWVVRVPPPVKVLSPITGGTFRACFESAAPPDFAGVASGRAITFDAKSTASERWRLAEVKPHQAAHFDAAEAAGAFAFVALSHPSGQWVLPWSLLGERWREWYANASRGKPAPRGTASLTAADLEEIGSRFTRSGWLELVPQGL